MPRQKGIGRLRDEIARMARQPQELTGMFVKPDDCQLIDEALDAATRAVNLMRTADAHLYYAMEWMERGDLQAARAEMRSARDLLGNGYPRFLPGLERAEMLRKPKGGS